MKITSRPNLQPILRCSASPLRSQRRWARVHDVRFVTSNQNSSRIIDRYKEKLSQKAQEEGHQSISSLREAYRDKISDLRHSALKSIGQRPSKHYSFDLQHPPPQAPSQPESSLLSTNKASTRTSSATPGIKPLSSYLDLEKVSSLPNKELEYIWRLRHAPDPLSLCAVIPFETYCRIYRTAQRHPQFILPLPRQTAKRVTSESDDKFTAQSGGEQNAADIHFLQWSFYPPASRPSSETVRTSITHTSTVLFTHLASYKLHGAYAPPHTTVTHHLDLADSHGLVLLNGSVMEDRGVSVEEGRWLVMCLQKFYDFEGHGGEFGNEKRQGLLQKFSKGDETFKIEELLDEAERVS